MAAKPIFPNCGLDPQLVLENRNLADLLGPPPFGRGEAFSGAAAGIFGSKTLFDTGFSETGGSQLNQWDGLTGAAQADLLTEYRADSANGVAGYDIWIEFKGSGWTSDLQLAFTMAADYFTTVITADIGGGGLVDGRTVDDLYVSAELATIDGAGGILGQAGPSYVWSANELTAAGEMEFDVADASNYLGRGLWDDIVTHELMHVLGIGTLWHYGEHDLVYDDPNPNNSDQYIGASGLAAFNEQFPGAPYIPVENDGGPGTAGGHWDEDYLGPELMTGYINPSGNYLMPFSVVSLADLGYSVEFQPYYGNPSV